LAISAPKKVGRATLFIGKSPREFHFASTLSDMSIRREVRLRKEFLLKKQQENVSETRNEKKRLLQAAIEEGVSIPTEIVKESRALYHEMEMDLAKTDTNLDDEYAQVGSRDPKVCVTTSRDPSSKLKQFAKEIKLCIPNSQVINRGTYRVDELVDACKKNDFTDIIVLNETRGSPDALIVSHLPFGPTAYFTIANCVMRHDIPECQPCSQAYPHLIIDGMTTKIGTRIKKILQALYPVPKIDSTRVITYANNNDFISFRHHISSKEKGNVTIKEVGPRFEMRPYEIKLGTMDQEEADKEWSLRNFVNSGRKKQAL